MKCLQNVIARFRKLEIVQPRKEEGQKNQLLNQKVRKVRKIKMILRYVIGNIKQVFRLFSKEIQGIILNQNLRDKPNRKRSQIISKEL